MSTVTGVITIDGPAASGKSSSAKLLAKEYDLPHISSGLLYRLVAYLAIGTETDLHDGPALVAMCHEFRVQLEVDPAGNRVNVNGRDLTQYITTEAVDSVVSFVARLPEVREWVNERLREIPTPFVIDGRDMGTAVFPDAEWKFYLTANARVRAERRQQERGDSVDEIERALIERDELDKKQSVPAADAIHIDGSNQTLAEVVALMRRNIDGAPA